jgi:mono/diheme cytochrome c family protein
MFPLFVVAVALWAPSSPPTPGSEARAPQTPAVPGGAASSGPTSAAKNTTPSAMAAPLPVVAPVPTIQLPAGFGLSTEATNFGSTLTVVVSGVPLPPPRPPAEPAALEQGRRLYQQRCAMCHGDKGAADGIGARRITPEPQHLDAVIWQASVTDEEITKAILEGGAAVSRSPMMPANRDLVQKPELVQNLVAYVRSLRAPYGSVLGSLLLGDQTSRAVFAPARKDGTATLVFADVPAGSLQVMVLVDGDGMVGCTLDLTVTKDTTVACP